jgi:hypothetical protein
MNQSVTGSGVFAAIGRPGHVLSVYSRVRAEIAPKALHSPCGKSQTGTFYSSWIVSNAPPMNLLPGNATSIIENDQVVFGKH